MIKGLLRVGCSKFSRTDEKTPYFAEKKQNRLKNSLSEIQKIILDSIYHTWWYIDIFVSHKYKGKQAEESNSLDLSNRKKILVMFM